MKDGGKEGEIKELMNEWILFGLNGWKYQLMDNKWKKKRVKKRLCYRIPFLSKYHLLKIVKSKITAIHRVYTRPEHNLNLNNTYLNCVTQVF